MRKIVAFIGCGIYAAIVIFAGCAALYLMNEVPSPAFPQDAIASAMRTWLIIFAIGVVLPLIWLIARWSSARKKRKLAQTLMDA